MCEQNESSQPRFSRLDRTQVHEANSYADFDFTSYKMFHLQIRLSLFLTVPNQGFQIGSDLYCYIDTMMQ